MSGSRPGLARAAGPIARRQDPDHAGVAHEAVRRAPAVPGTASTGSRAPLARDVPVTAMQPSWWTTLRTGSPNAREGPAPAGRRLPPLAATLLVAALLAGWQILPNAPDWFQPPGAPPSWTSDLDTALIHDGLLQAPRFGDTFRWWTGPWVGEVPFYRPLTSYVFWAEWRAFGDRESLYGIPTAAAHVLAALLFTALVYALARRLRLRWPALAGIAGALGFLGYGSSYRQITTAAVWLRWKNQPDALAAAACFAALLFYLRAQEGSRRSLPAAAVAYLAGCSFKEIAVPLPFLCLLLEAPAWRPRPSPPALRRLLVLGAAALAFLAARAAALRGPGYTYGSNTVWLSRTLLHLLGPFAEVVVERQWLGTAVGLWTFLLGCAWIAYRRRSTRLAPARAPRAAGRALFVAALLLAAGCSLMGAVCVQQAEGYPPEEPVTRLVAGALLCLQPMPLATASGTLTFLLAIAVLAPRHRHVLWLSLAWTVAFLSPLVLSPGPSHRYYLSQSGYVLLYALALGVAVTRWTRGRPPS
jgi:hypothetical protein